MSPPSTPAPRLGEAGPKRISGPRVRTRSEKASRIAYLACALTLAGCNFGDGIAPPAATLNFPIAVALSPAAEDSAPRWLYVVNSNFDLRFSDGTLMAFDLDAIDGALAPCTESAPCAFDDVTPFLASEVGIGSHADGLAVSPGGTRLYIASRARRNLTFVNWDESAEELRCETSEDDDAFPSCVEQDAAQGRDIELDGDPVAVATGRLADIGGGEGNFVLLALREGSVALFIDDEGAAQTEAPQLVHVADGFPASVVTLTMQPGTGIGWLTSTTTNAIGRVGIAVDPVARDRSFLYDAGSLRLGGLDTGIDSRDLQFDPSRPTERALVLMRRPEAVVELDLTREGLNADDVAVADAFEVDAGPSRLAVERIGGRTYAFATTFDGRKMYVIDVTGGAPVAVVGGFSGPFELMIDSARELAYVVDFSLSVIRIVDLSGLSQGEAPFIRATLGRPTPIEDFAN